MNNKKKMKFIHAGILIVHLNLGLKSKTKNEFELNLE